MGRPASEGPTPPRFPGAAFDVVAIASSAGGLEALTAVVTNIAQPFPAAVAIVQHLDPRHRSLMADILQRRSGMPAKQAEDGEPLKAGTLFLARPDYHLLVNADGTLSLSQTALVHFVRPSGDLLFESVAASYRDRSLALILTGSGRDGELGVRAIHAMGGTVIVQEPETAAFRGMPDAAIETGVVDFILPLEDIAPAITRLVVEGRDG